MRNSTGHGAGPIAESSLRFDRRGPDSGIYAPVKQKKADRFHGVNLASVPTSGSSLRFDKRGMAKGGTEKSVFIRLESAIGALDVTVLPI